MMDIAKMVQAEIALGYSDLNARAKVCQDYCFEGHCSGSFVEKCDNQGWRCNEEQNEECSSCNAGSRH